MCPTRKSDLFSSLEALLKAIKQVKGKKAIASSNLRIMDLKMRTATTTSIVTTPEAGALRMQVEAQFKSTVRKGGTRKIPGQILSPNLIQRSEAGLELLKPKVRVLSRSAYLPLN